MRVWVRAGAGYGGANAALTVRMPSVSLVRVLFAFLAKCLTFHPDYKDTFRDCALLDLLVWHLRYLADYLFSAESRLHMTLAPVLLTDDVYHSALGLLHLMLEKNFDNVKKFKAADGRRGLFTLLASSVHRRGALNVLQLFNDADNVRDLLGVLRAASAPLAALHLVPIGRPSRPIFLCVTLDRHPLGLHLGLIWI